MKRKLGVKGYGIIALAIGCITFLEFCAINNGLDGEMFRSAVASLVAIPAILITRRYYKQKEGSDSGH